MTETDPTNPKGSIAEEYNRQIADGLLVNDPAQSGVIAKLDEIRETLMQQKTAGGSLFDIFRPRKTLPIRGLYIHGGVGCGKTMLMDLFYETIEYDAKRRMHFHEFMAEVHERIAAARAIVDGDPIPAVAENFADEASLLCFDELHVTDIADAMVIARLFDRLFASGVIVIATSNAAPDELYRHGLNRPLFLPFIDLVHANMDVVWLRSEKDYRRDKLVGEKLYFVPADEEAKLGLDRHWRRLTGKATGPIMVLEVKGRRLTVPQALKGVARFDFADLCARPLGAIDYLQIAHAFHTVLIDNIPRLSPENRNEARRFINLIDTFYDARVGLIASADRLPDALYDKGDGSDLFLRTSSRLIEMQSEGYLDARSDRVYTLRPTSPGADN